MAAVTALILIGSGHPNDTSHDPKWILRLWEGDSAAWTGTELGEVEPTKRCEPANPIDIASEGCRLAREVIAESGGRSVLVTVLDGSTLGSQLNKLDELLPEVDLYIMQSVGSRVSSMWSSEVCRSGILKK